MKKTDNVIRVGNTVLVTDPQIITRIGYDFTFQDAVKEIRADDEYMEQVRSLLRKAKISMRAWDRVEDALIKPLAYELVRKRFHTGNERKLYTELKENLRDVEVVIVSKKIVRTGTYFSPTGVGTEDYEPGGLNNPKTHVVLEIAIGSKWNSEGLLIEQCNVKKMQ